MSLRAGSQVVLCDVPVRLDNYEGCSHLCKYCFTRFKKDITQIKAVNSSSSLIKFITGERNKETAAFDWDIPIHWGGLSDPFQPLEKKYKSSYQLLKIFAEYDYPFIVSTKGKLIAENEYLDLVSKCNAVIQVSMLSPQYDAYENIKFKDRLNILDKLSKVAKRVIIRMQPYIPKVKEDIINIAQRYKDSGVYGIIIEGIKLKQKTPGTVKHYGDYVIPLFKIKSDFLEIKKVYNNLGIKVFAGENRIRSLGDSLTCCGVDGLKGFKVNKFNINHLLFDKENAIATDAMKIKGKGTQVFKALCQETFFTQELNNRSFEQIIQLYFKTQSDVIG